MWQKVPELTFELSDGENRYRAREWSAAPLAMDHADPRWRSSIDLEGVIRWLPGQKQGYDVVNAALAP